jgi:LysM repeat protein
MKKVTLLVCMCLMLAITTTACRLVTRTPDPNEIQRLVAEAVKATLEAMPTATPYPTYTPVLPAPTYAQYPTRTVVSGSSVTNRPVSATLTPQPGASTPFHTHIVVAGDTLSGIAKEYGTTVEAIVEANGITNPSLIVVGQVLNIPIEEAGATSATRTPTPTGTPEPPTPTPTETPAS